MVTRFVLRSHGVPSAIATLSLLLCACGGSGSGNAPASAPTAGPAPTATAVTYSLAGSVSGLVGSGLVLNVAANGSSSVSVTANGPVSLAMALAANTTYAVTVATQPSSPAQVCSVSNGSGTVSTTNITNVTISCAAPAAAAPSAPTSSTTVPVTVTVSGLPAPGLMLQFNSSQNFSSVLTINANGVTTVQRPPYSDFEISPVGPTPPGGLCTVSPSFGTVPATGVNIAVTCGLGYSIYYTLSGLSGSGLMLQLNGMSPVGTGPNGKNVFPALFPSGTSYTVSVVTQPTFPTQSCSVVNGTGTIANADVTNVQINCTTVGYPITGTAYGVVGSGLTLQLNGANSVSVTQAGAVGAFPAVLPTGTPYTITVATQPSNPTQNCTLNNAQGTIGTADVTNLQVVCATPASPAATATHNAYFIGAASPGTTNSAVLIASSNDGGAVVTPTSSLVPISPADAFVSVVTDATGNIYVGTVTLASQAGLTNPQASNPRILVFPSGSTGAATPNRTIQMPAQSTPAAIAVDSGGDVYVADNDTVYEYAPGASGSATPTRSLSAACTYLAVDPQANIVCAEGLTVSVFAPTQSGSAKPIRTFQPGVGFIVDNDGGNGGYVVGLALDPAGDIFVVINAVGTLPLTSLFEVPGGVNASEQQSAVTSVNSVVTNLTPVGSAQVTFNAFAGISFEGTVNPIAFDAAGNLYINQNLSIYSDLVAESLLWQFAPQSGGGFALASSEAVNGALGSFAIN